jgi:hypothetical protein
MVLLWVLIDDALLEWWLTQQLLPTTNEFWSQPKQTFAEFYESGILVLLLCHNFVVSNVAHIQDMLC